jgi:hypothetical protein
MFFICGFYSESMFLVDTWSGPKVHFAGPSLALGPCVASICGGSGCMHSCDKCLQSDDAALLAWKVNGARTCPGVHPTSTRTYDATAEL